MSSADQKPNLSEEEIRRWMRENYSLDGSLEPLPGERDLNFKIKVAGGGPVVCKISSASEDLDFLAAQNEVMSRLNQSGFTVVPDVLRSNRGEFLVSLVPPQTGDGQSFVGRVLTYVPGRPLSECAPYGNHLIRNLGRTVGQFDRALQGYDHPAFHHKFDWDLAHALEVVERYQDLISDPHVRDGVTQIAKRFSEVVPPQCHQLRTSVIHNDANDYNVLAEGNEITGLIDFGDMVYSYTICDLAIAMAYAVLGADDIPQVIVAITSGYTEAMPIEEEEAIVLFPMMCMRLAVSACMAAHQMRLRPDDPYLLISQEPIRKTLPKLLALDLKEVHELIKETLE